MNLGKPRRVLQLAVDLVLVTELGASCSVLFELDSDLLSVGADSEVDVTERSTTNTLRNTVFLHTQNKQIVCGFSWIVCGGGGDKV
jgi:hypothetical protein